MANTMNAVNLLKKHGFTPVFQESAGAHVGELARLPRDLSGQIFRESH
jgi:hypothetical protein